MSENPTPSPERFSVRLFFLSFFFIGLPFYAPSAAWESGAPVFHPLENKHTQENVSEIIRAARLKQDALKDFTADFSYSLNFPGERSSVLYGSLIYQSGKYVVRLPDQSVYCDGDARWYYFMAQREVIIRDYESEIGITMPFQIFHKGKSARYLGKKKIGQAVCDVIFFDEMPGSSYQQAKVWVGTENKMVRKIVLMFENQGSYTFTFSNIELNQGYSLSDFRFHIENYPGVNIVDERSEK